MTKLQRPPVAYMNGQLVAWEDAKIHIGSESLTRGISIFEGIKGYWRSDGQQFALLALHEHYDRLVRSAALNHLPFTVDFDSFRLACGALARVLLVNDRDLWLRPTILAIEGHWGLDTVTDLVITAYHQEMKKPDPIEVGISTWQKPPDTMLPARIKSAANYQLGRLARIEGRRQGYSDMILLNHWGRVAEATGSCVLMVRNGRVVTPPTYEGCLESITVNILEALCGSMRIPFERRPIERTELLVADEMCLVGTLMEIGIVRRLEAREFPDLTPVLTRLSASFWSCVRDQTDQPGLRMTPI